MSDQQRRACYFCGSTTSKVSSGHVIAKSIADMLPEPPRGAPYLRVIDLWNAEQQATVRVDERDIRSLRNMQVNAPCRDCNSGWMQEIEKEFRQVFAKMLRLPAVSLSGRALRHLATWGTMTAMMAECLAKGSEVTVTGMRADVMRERRPCRGIQVLVGASTGERSQARITHNAMRVEAHDNSLAQTGTLYNNVSVATIFVGPLLLIVLCTTLDMHFNVGDRLGGRIGCAWPPDQQAIWSARPGLSDQEVEGLRQGVIEGLKAGVRHR